MSIHASAGALPHLPVRLLGYNTCAGHFLDNIRKEENGLSINFADCSVVSRVSPDYVIPELVAGPMTPRNGNTLITYDGTEMRVEAGAADAAYAYQRRFVPANTPCRLVVDYTNVQGVVRVYAGLNAGNNAYYDSGSLTGSGTIDVEFTPTSADPYLNFYASTGATLGDASLYDNISCKVVGIESFSGNINDFPGFNYPSPPTRNIFNELGVLNYSAHNLLTYSEDLTQWTNGQTTDSGQIVTSDAATSRQIIYLSDGNQPLNEPRKFRVKVEPGTHQFVCLTMQWAVDQAIGAVFNLTAGQTDATETHEGATSGTIISTSQVDNGDGSYTIEISGKNVNTTTLTVAVGFATAATGNTFDTLSRVIFPGNGTQNFSLIRAQLSKYGASDAYLKTTGSARYALQPEHDPATLVSSTTSKTIAAGVVGLSATFAHDGTTPFAVGNIIRASNTSASTTNYMVGIVTAQSSGSVTINPIRVVGSGTISDWKIIKCLGVTPEGAASNYVPQSVNLTDAAWTTTNATVTSPDVFDLTTVKVVPDSGSRALNADGLFDEVPFSAGMLAVSAEFKSGGLDFAVIGLSNGAGFTATASFNLATKTVATLGAHPSTANTLSGEVKGLSDGWCRCTFVLNYLSSLPRLHLTGSTVAANSAYSRSITGDGIGGVLIRNPQVEIGSVATSYIPTAGSTGTRAAMNPYIPTANFAYNQAEGSIFARFTPGVLNPNNVVFSLFESSSNRITFSTTAAANHPYIASGGGAVANINSGTLISGTDTTIGHGYKANDFITSLNGAAGVPDTGGAVPSAATSLSLGQEQSGTKNLNAPLMALVYLPVRLEDAQYPEWNLI